MAILQILGNAVLIYLVIGAIIAACGKWEWHCQKPRFHEMVIIFVFAMIVSFPLWIALCSSSGRLRRMEYHVG